MFGTDCGKLLGLQILGVFGLRRMKKKNINVNVANMIDVVDKVNTMSSLLVKYRYMQNLSIFNSYANECHWYIFLW